MEGPNKQFRKQGVDSSSTVEVDGRGLRPGVDLVGLVMVMRVLNTAPIANDPYV